MTLPAISSTTTHVSPTNEAQQPTQTASLPVTGTGQSAIHVTASKAESVIKAHKANLVLIQARKMKLLLDQSINEQLKAEMGVATKSLAEGTITQKQYAQLCYDANSRAINAEQAAFQAAHEAAQKPCISSMYSELEEFAALEVISLQEHYQNFFKKLVEDGIITKEKSPELFSKAVDGKPAAQEPSTPAIAPQSSNEGGAPNPPFLSGNDLSDLISTLHKDLKSAVLAVHVDKSVETGEISQKESNEIFFKQLVENGIITKEKFPELFPETGDGKPAA
ncbi:hypothetical protein Rin_00007540 [Candidatus Regiella insecticola 5.15]|uniref:Uncharacterized protein n=1 Tax=Candidatus Regiella insecticola 5.15 TaxID=1005043 RepID=G2GYA0_9ENTR|nr:hypothetical protein [Candidatus Regiella insecticola]EGY29291.1 hypothetical protein Rin_00007540 [Candidatus Regiella insecticola 5.15]